MPITCITGTPGAGKTLSALEEMFKELKIPVAGRTVEEIKADLLSQKVRPLYVCNVRGLRPGLFNEIPDPFSWEDLPDGSLVVVDEAWEFFGKQLKNTDDSRILNFAKHRHRGFDFIFTTQDPGQLTSFIRSLLGRHIHVTRKFGTETTIRYEWPHVQESPNGQTAKSNALEGVWRYPHELFQLYESATLHTVKRKIPAKIIFALLFGAFSFIAIPAAFYGLYASFTPDATTEPTPSEEAATSEARSVASTEEEADSGGEHLTLEEYVYQRTARLEGDPASAPIYDRFEVKDYPRTLCMITGDQRVERISCKCRTQQMTPVEVSDMQCVYMARNGVWDPRLDSSGRDNMHRDHDRERDQEDSTASASGSSARGIGQGVDRSISANYTPPDFQSR